MTKIEKDILDQIVAGLPTVSDEGLDDMRRLCESLPSADPRLTILEDIETEIASRFVAAY